MASALLHASKENGEVAPLLIRCLFDTGSEKSYITAATCRALNVFGIKEKILIGTLGADLPSSFSVQRVALRVSAVNEPDTAVCLQFLSLPKICDPIGPVQFIPNVKWPFLQGLSFADNYPRGRVEIDMLIGLDHYWSLVDGAIRRGANFASPVAMKTVFGWVLCGTDANSTTCTLLSIKNSPQETNLSDVLEWFFRDWSTLAF